MSAVDEIAEQIAGLTVGSGYYAQRVSMDEAREVVPDVLATVRDIIREDSPDGEQAREALGLESWRPRHRPGSGETGGEGA